MMANQQGQRNYSVLIPQLALPWISSAACAVVAYSIRGLDLLPRFVVGCGAIKFFAKTTDISNVAWKSILPEAIRRNKYASIILLINGVFAMLWTSFSGFFGGKRYFKAHGIDSYRKAIIASLCPGQVYFRKNEGARKKALKNLAKIAGYFAVAMTVAKIIKSGLVSMEVVKSNFFVHHEVIALMVSIMAAGQNISANLHYLIFGGSDDIEVVEPYGFVYFCPSIRDFWKRWSRPVGELLRWMVYEPLGGRNRYWLSVPALFATNCYIHFDFSKSTYGDPAYKEWSQGFAVMGGTMALYMLTENIFLKKKKRNNAVMDASQFNNVETKSDVGNSIYWKIWSFGLFHASMITTLKLLNGKAWVADLEDMCNTLLLENLVVKI